MAEAAHNSNTTTTSTIQCWLSQRDGRGMVIVWGILLCFFLVTTVGSLPAARLPISDPENRFTRDQSAYLRSETAYLEELVVGSGDTLELLCNAPGLSLSVFWYKDGIGILPTNRTHIGQKLLRIINVSYDDSGLYSCKPRHSTEMLRNFTVRVTDFTLNTVSTSGHHNSRGIWTSWNLSRGGCKKC